MRCVERHAKTAWTLMVIWLLTSTAAHACELVLTEHRTGKDLARLALSPSRPAADVAFTHSVLGTPVLDRYVWRHDPQGWRAYLVEERFEGEGYGLPSAPASGERLLRDGRGWRLQLDRLVDPFVILPLPEQSTRLVLTGERVVLLGQLSQRSIQIRAENCPLP